MKSYKTGRLFFKYIKGTKLETLGWTSEKLKAWMLEQGIIKELPDGTWLYTEGNNMNRRELLNFFSDRDAA